MRFPVKIVAKLIAVERNQGKTELELRGAVRIGRDPACELPLTGNGISRQHLLLRSQGDDWYVEDCGSTNGTRLNDTLLSPGTPAALKDGDRLAVGEWLLTFVADLPDSPPLQDVPRATFSLASEQTIGRDPTCTIVLDSPNVSRRHCRIKQDGQNTVLEDLNSRNGTFLNGVLVGGPETLHTGDEVEVGLNRFVFRNRTLEHYAQDGTVRLDVTEITQIVQNAGKPKQLLHNVSFVLPPREFIAIVGAAGAGKSTLLKAITGFLPASSGSVSINGVDFYSHLELFRTIIGYVPQEDIVHRELTVATILRYAARLRLPPDTDSAEIEKLLDNTLQELDMSRHKNAPFANLSGGEKKRVNVAVELLTRPSLLFLDEPTAGLDPATEYNFVELVKKLAKEGRSIVMVTHSIASMAECDKLLFLARGGRVAFYGPPKEALAYFEVDDYLKIYLKVNDNSQSPEAWQKEYLASEAYARYVREPLANAPKHRQGQTVHVAKHLGATRARPSGWDQFGILCQRYIDIFKGDLRNTLFLLVQAPLIATLLALVFRADIFGNGVPLSPGFSAKKGGLLLFCMVISAMLFGIVNAAREITKESAIYRRERLVNLRIIPYLMSKVAVLSVLCFVQSALLVGIVRLRIDFHLSVGAFAAFFFTILMATLCGMLLGLTVSTIASTNDQAMSLVPVVVLPQIIFSGLLEIESLSFLSKIMPSYWAYSALGNLTHLPAHSPENHFDITPVPAWLALAVIGVGFGLLSFWLLLRKDQSR